MEDPIIIGTNKDVSPFESEACEKYLQSFQLNLEEIVPLAEPKESKPDPDETPSVEAASIPLKVQSRRPTLEINGVQVKPKTLADYREAIRKSLDGKISDEIVNDENKSRTKNLRRHTIESPLVSEKKNVKVLGEHCNKKTAKSNSNQKSPKVKEEPNSENTVTRSGRVSKKVLKVETGKEKHKKQEDEETEHQNETTSKKTVKQCPDSDYFPNTFLRPDSKVQVEAVDSKVVMYTGAGRHLHSYAIHNYNLLTENTFDVTAWQRDFALTALNNNIDSSGRSIFRSTVPLVSTKLIQIKNDLKEGKIDCKLNKTDLGRNERLHNRSRRRKKRKAVWTKQKTHSIPVMNAKKMKEDVKDVSIESDKDDDVDIEDLSTDKEDRLETSPQIKDEVPTLKRKLNPNEEDDLYREMYGTPHKRVKLKLIQTQSDSNKKPQWTSVNYEKEIRPEETEDEMSNIVSTVMDNMLNYVELNNDYNEKDVTLDPTYFEEYKLESEDSTDLPKQLKRKRNNSSRVKWELKRLDVLIFEHESEGNKNGDGTCSNDFCKLGCICESISVRPKNIAINHCSEINCIFKCVCPAPRRNEHKPPIRDESEIIRSVAEKRNGRNLAKKEKEWIQTLVKTNDEYIIMQSSTGNKNKREVKKPERYREESLHWENVAHQKFLYEKVKRNLREKAKKANNDDSSPPAEDEDTESSPVNEESSTVSLKDKQRAEIKLLKRLRKKKRLQMEMLQQQQQEEQSEESKPNKTSPFKFYFCKEHMVLDCKCKAKKETKEEKEMDAKLKQLEEDISALTSNLGNLSSKEKDKLLSLMREQQSLTESKEKANVTETERKDEVAPPAGMDEEYIDLNTLSKFIPHPDGDRTGDNQDGTDVKDPADNLTETKADPSQSESTDHDHTQENEETLSSALQDDNPANIKTKPLTSLRPHEVNDPEEKDDEVEVLDSGMSGGSANSQQGLGNLSLNSIQSLLNQKAPFTNATKLPIDFYGFMLHNGIGYLPISQYSPNQLYMIFKNPTKRDPLPIIFHGPDYLQKASTWANGFLQGYVKFHPKSQNPCWKIIKFSNMQELKNWKLFDFKFLKDFSPMVLTDEGMYKVKGKILYKLLLLPQERTFKFKQVMEAKLDMDDLSFIEKYEYFHNCRDTLPSNKPIRFIQRTQLLGENEPQDGLSAANEISGMSDNQLSEETGGSTPMAVMPKVSPNGSTAPIILSKSSPNAAQTIVIPKVSPTATSQPLIIPQFSPTVSLPNIVPKTSPSTTVQHKPPPSPAVHSGGIFIKPADALLQRPRATAATPASQALHRQNIINNLNRLALSRVQSAQAMSRGGGGMFQGFQPQGRPPTARGMLGYIPRPRVAPVGKKPPPPYPAHLNPAVVKVDNLERYKQFIQISDIVTTPSPARTPPPTAQSKSHPILSKSLATPTLPLGDAPVCIEKLAPAKPDSDIESNLDTYRITKISAEDTNNNRNSPVPRKYIQPNRHIQSQGAFPVSTSLMNTFRTANSPILSIPKSAISSMTSISPMSALPRSSSSPSSSHTVTSLTSSPMNGAFSSPMPSAGPKRAPVPGLKPIKKPLPGLKAINPAGFASPVAPSKRLTEEVDISMSPVKNQTGRDHARRHSTAEPECVVEEFPPRYRAAPPPPPELSIVECLTRMENTPITFTPNGEDTVTISPIVVNSHTTGGARPPYKEKMGATVFERLSAVKRLNDGESIHVIARSMNVTEDSVAQWARNFERLQKRTGHRAMMSGGTVHSFNGTVHSFNGTPES